MNQFNVKSRAAQQGFTLIELIVVIVILGIMAATALPKFADIGGDARVAKMQAALAAVKSTSATAHAAYLAKGNNNSITMDGAATTLVNGYPAAADIASLAGLTGDYVATVTATSVDINADSDAGRTACKITYGEATATVPPTFSAAPTAANCK